MRIGILGTLSKPIIASSTGGTEAYCALLATGLAVKGHQVSILATPQSVLPDVTIIDAAPKTRSVIRDEYVKKNNRDLVENERNAIDMSLCARILIKAKELEDQFDILHDNTSSFIIASSSDQFRIPIVTTLHMPTSGLASYVAIPPLVSTVTNQYISISNYQKLHAPMRSELIYHGIPVERYMYNAEGSDSLIWIGRISPNALKGLPEALDVTRDMHKKLRFAGNISDQAYYDQSIQPRLHDLVDVVGLLTSEQEKNAFYGKAKAALFPIQWEEPFGYVFVEAMACGTPLIAYARGSVSEIIEDGKTGFIVNPGPDDQRGDWIIKTSGIAGIQEAIERIYAMPTRDYEQMRRNARNRVETLFSIPRMILEYEKLYRRLVRDISH